MNFRDKGIGLFILVGWIYFISSCTLQQNYSGEIHAIENGLTPTIQSKDSLRYFNISERMNYYNVPGVSIAVLKGGKVRWAKGYGIANTKDSSRVKTNTLFQAGSISKPVAALSVMKLAEEGKVDLDTKVNKYLESWEIPENRFTRDSSVTLRRLLTHTAGTTVHGFPGYTQSDTMPSITQVLNGKGNTAPVRVDTIPGSDWRYSGGGYTILQKVVEDVTNMPLDQYMDNQILHPLGMRNSTYKQPLPSDKHQQASAAYDQMGQLVKGHWHNYPQQAAAGLWTTSTDLAKYCSEIQEIRSGKNTGLLEPSSVDRMLTKYKNQWGLGPRLIGKGDSLLFQHGGKNAGFSNTLACFAKKGDGVIIMSNADNGVYLIGEILRSIMNYYNWGGPKSRTVEELQIPATELTKWTGRYRHMANKKGRIINVELKNGRLILSIKQTGFKINPIPIDNNTFLSPVNGDKFLFHAATDSTSAYLTINGSDQFIKLENSQGS